MRSTTSWWPVVALVVVGGETMETTLPATNLLVAVAVVLAVCLPEL